MSFAFVALSIKGQLPFDKSSRILYCISKKNAILVPLYAIIVYRVAFSLEEKRSKIASNQYKILSFENTKRQERNPGNDTIVEHSCKLHTAAIRGTVDKREFHHKKKQNKKTTTTRQQEPVK